METVIKYIASLFAGVVTVALVLPTIINYTGIVVDIYSLFRRAFSFGNAFEKVYYKRKKREIL